MMMMTMIFLTFGGDYGCEVLILHYVICLFGSERNSLRYTWFDVCACSLQWSQAKYNNTMKSINTTNTFSNDSQDYENGHPLRNRQTKHHQDESRVGFLHTLHCCWENREWPRVVFPRELDFVELIFDDQQKCRLRDIRFDLGRWSSSHGETEFRLGVMSPRLRAIPLKIYCQFADAHKNNAFFKMSSLCKTLSTFCSIIWTSCIFLKDENTKKYYHLLR